MKKQKHFYPTPLLKGVVLILMALWCHTMVYSQQSGIVLRWDSQVGCLEYEDREKLFLEDIEEGDCIKTCANSVVNYELSGSNIASVDWSVAGGTVLSITGAGLILEVQWGSAGSGAVSFDIVLTDDTVISRTVCVDIMRGPFAEFIIDSPGRDPIFCAEVPIYFTNTSHHGGGSQIVSYFWDFGDPYSTTDYSSAFEPSYTYMSSGTYTVTLQVRNECNCVSEYSMVIVIDRPALPISCPTVVCEGAIETYTIEGVRCEIEWDVQGGQVLNYPTSTSVQVVWDDIGSDGYGYLSAKADCMCPVWTTVKIPVVPQNGIIEGETVLCAPEQSRYRLPQWPGTFYEWTLINIDGSPPGTTLIQTDQLNEVVINGVEPGNYLLRCTFTNALDNCGGSAELEINIKQTLEISGPSDVCEGDSVTFTSNISSPNSIWRLYKNGSLLTLPAISGTSFTYTFNDDGLYQLKVSNSEACEQVTKIIKVHSTGTFSGSITGNTIVCTGLSYTYSFPSPGSSYNLVWSVTGGSIQGPDIGNQVEIIFNDPAPVSGYYEVSVIKQLKVFPYCETEPVTLKVYPKDPGIVITNIDDEDLFCPSSYTFFSFTSPYMSEIEDILWKIESDAGNSNFGNVIDGQGTDDIEVSWNEIYMGNNTGKVILQIRFCGKLQTFEYPVTLQFPPVLTWTDSITEVCAGELNAFQLSFESDFILDSGEIVWDLGNGTTHTELITASNDTFTSPMMYYPNTLDDNINYTVSVTVNYPNGCQIPSVVQKTMTVKPSPRIAITPGYNYVVCPNGSGNYSTPTITANLQSGISLSGSILWYKQGTPNILVGTGPTFVVTQAHGEGYYFAEAMATNGCKERSRKFSVTERCGNSPGCSLPFSPDVSVDIAEQTNCYTFKLSGYFDHDTDMDSVEWIYTTFPGIFMTSSDDNNAEFVVSAPGEYIVFYRVAYNNGSGGVCLRTRSVNIKVPYLSDLKYKTTCNTNGTFDVTLLNNSTHILPDNELDDMVYTFYVNNVMMQSGSLEEYTATSLSAGTYTLALELTNPHYPGILTCRSETTVTLTIPDTAFTITHNPNCVEQQVILTLNTATQAGYQYEWGFDGTSFIIPNPEDNINQTIINLKEGDEFTLSEITLTITDLNGCSFTNIEFTDEVVSQAKYVGSIIGGGPYCDGDIALLYFELDNPSDPSPYSYQWMQGNAPIPGATSSTYSPTVNGSYWVVLYNAAGCVDKSTPAANVNFYPRPFVGIGGPDVVCAGNAFTLEGTISSGGGTLEKRWLRGTTVIQAWDTLTPAIKVFNESTPGNYTYRLEVRVQGNNSCYEWATFDVEVLGVPVITPDYDIISCQPYQVELTATVSPSVSGTYLWSNGDSGDTILVNEGGAYSVTFITDDGCSRTAQLYVPKSPEIYLWVFPSGCADFCKLELGHGITLPAPNASFETYSWDLNSIPDVYGTGYSPDYTFSQEGTLTLSLANEYCTVISEPLMISEIKDCKECNLEFNLDENRRYDNPYLYYELVGILNNTFGSAVTVTISSATGDGIYIPSTIYIPFPGSYNFSPLTFIPYGSFSGGMSHIRFEVRDTKGDLLCFEEVKFEYSSAEQARPMVQTELKIIPNPTQSLTALDYDLGEGKEGYIKVFDMMGIQRWEQKITQTQGSISFDATRLPTGNYVVVLFADGKAVNQQILIKK